MRAAFYQFLPECPKGRYIGRDDAARYVAEIARVMDMERWTRRERETLRQLKQKWTARATGKDSRYLAMGNAPGLNDKHRKQTAADIVGAIRSAISSSLAEAAPSSPTQKFVIDPKWPLGRANPDRRG